MMSIFKKKHTQSYDKMNKKPVLKTSICTGEQVAGFQDIHTGKIEEIMLIKQTGDIDTFKQIICFSHDCGFNNFRNVFLEKIFLC